MPSVIVSPEGTSYSQEAVLGSGAFGTILKCKHGDRFESDCVVKRVKLARQTPQERFASVQELAVLQQLRHRNLVRGIDGWIEAKHTACLVMDYCDGGDLASLLHARKGQALLEDDVCIILVQVGWHPSHNFFSKVDAAMLEHLALSLVSSCGGNVHEKQCSV